MADFAAQQEINGLRERCARLEDALRKAQPFVERVAASAPTEPRRLARQREAMSLAADLRILIGKTKAAERVKLSASEAAQYGKLRNSNPNMLTEEFARFEAQQAKAEA